MKKQLIKQYLKENGFSGDLELMGKTIGFKIWHIKRDMRRFKKKLLGWLNPKVIEKVCIQKRDVAKVIATFPYEIIKTEDLSKSVTMITYKK